KVTGNDALAGTADPNAVVMLTEGVTNLGTAIANASGAWTFSPTSLAQGAHTIVASETDLAGNTGTASLSFTYDTMAPAVTEALVDDALTGTGDANAVVTLTEAATTLGTVVADASGTWTFDAISLSQGAHTVDASETDVAGNTGTTSLSF